MSLPANEFAFSFAQAQIGAAKRTIFGNVWPLLEITEDQTAKNMQAIGKFIDPILSEVLKHKRELKAVQEVGGVDKVDEAETFLQHMVNLTDGKKLRHRPTL